MQRTFYITDMISSRGGYKASRENIKIFKKFFNGKIIDLNSLNNNFILKIKFKFYKILNFFIHHIFYNGIPVTLPQYFNFIVARADQSNLFFIHYANQIFNYKLIRIYKKSVFVFFIYDEWFINGLYHFNNKLNNKFLKKIDNKIFFNKLKYLKNNNVILMASSNYLKKKCEKIFPEKKIYEFNYPTNTSFWKRENKGKSLKKMFLNNNKRYILFVAKGGTENFRKGGFYLKKILKSFKKEKMLGS